MPGQPKPFTPLTSPKSSDILMRDFPMFNQNSTNSNRSLRSAVNVKQNSTVLQLKRKVKPENMSNVERYRAARDKYFKFTERTKQKYREMTPPDCGKKTKSQQTQSEPDSDSESDDECPPKKLQGVRTYKPRKQPSKTCPKPKRVTKPRCPRKSASAAKSPKRSTSAAKCPKRSPSNASNRKKSPARRRKSNSCKDLSCQ